jgi:arsenate reductase (thioredoxin)
MSGVIGGIVTLMLLGGAGAGKTRAGRDTIVFVCQHGNVKSLIAAQWFNRLAAERGLSVRATARGVTPENPVPPAIAERLRGDGLDVAGYEARELAPADLERAARLVLIGVEPPAWLAGKTAVVEKWEGIPPASERYEESRDALRARIEALLGALGRPPERP